MDRRSPSTCTDANLYEFFRIEVFPIRCSSHTYRRGCAPKFCSSADEIFEKSFVDGDPDVISPPPLFFPLKFSISAFFLRVPSEIPRPTKVPRGHLAIGYETPPNRQRTDPRFCSPTYQTRTLSYLQPAKDFGGILSVWTLNFQPQLSP